MQSCPTIVLLTLLLHHYAFTVVLDPTCAHLALAHTLRCNTMLRPTYHFSTFWIPRSQLRNYSATFIPGGSINLVFLVPSYCLLRSCVCVSSFDVSFLNAFIRCQNVYHQCSILLNLSLLYCSVAHQNCMCFFMLFLVLENIWNLHLILHEGGLDYNFT
jgi:hypothetical protein